MADFNINIIPEPFSAQAFVNSQFIQVVYRYKDKTVAYKNFRVRHFKEAYLHFINIVRQAERFHIKSVGLYLLGKEQNFQTEILVYNVSESSSCQKSLF